jgi:hypothetical protein
MSSGGDYLPRDVSVLPASTQLPGQQIQDQFSAFRIALLLAASGGVEKLEGNVGGNLNQSSRAQAGLGLFRPADLLYDAVENKARRSSVWSSGAFFSAAPTVTANSRVRTTA